MSDEKNNQVEEIGAENQGLKEKKSNSWSWMLWAIPVALLFAWLDSGADTNWAENKSLHEVQGTCQKVDSASDDPVCRISQRYYEAQVRVLREAAPSLCIVARSQNNPNAGKICNNASAFIEETASQIMQTSKFFSFGEAVYASECFSALIEGRNAETTRAYFLYLDQPCQVNFEGDPDGGFLPAIPERRNGRLPGDYFKDVLGYTGRLPETVRSHGQEYNFYKK